MGATAISPKDQTASPSERVGFDSLDPALAEHGVGDFANFGF